MTPRRLYKRNKEFMGGVYAILQIGVPEFVVTYDDLQVTNEFAVEISFYMFNYSGHINISNYRLSEFKELFIPASALDAAICQANYPELYALVRNKGDK